MVDINKEIICTIIWHLLGKVVDSCQNVLEREIVASCSLKSLERSG